MKNRILNNTFKICISMAWLMPMLSFFLFWSCKQSQLDIKNSGVAEQVKYTSQVNWIGHWRDEGAKAQLVREMANEFEFLNQNIKVNLRFPEDIYQETNDDDISFVIKMLQSPNPEWDIIRIKNNYGPISILLDDPDWGKKYLVDFSQIPEFVNNHIPMVFNETFKAQNGGITVGPYSEGFFYSVWYNKELADKIGVNIKDFGMTPNDLISYIKATYAYNKKNNTDIIPLFETGSWLTTEHLLTEMFYSQFTSYDEIVNTDFDPQKLVYLEKVLQIFEEMAQYNPLPKNRSEIVFEKTMEYPLAGKCLIYVNASWMYNDWEIINKADLLKMYPAELPTFNANSPCYIGGYQACWAVLKNAPNKENAIKLMTYWTTSQVAEKWVRVTKSPTAVKGSFTSMSLGVNQFENFEYKMHAKYGANLLTAYDNRYILGFKNRNVKIPFIEILENQYTAQQAMSLIKNQLAR